MWAGIRTIEHRRIVSTWIYINISYHYANVQLEILVGMTNTTKVLADVNLAVQYWNAIRMYNVIILAVTKMDCQTAKFT